jgi:hypothetical protein
MPPRRARMRVGEVVGVVKSVPPRGEVVVVVKSRQEFKSALARAMNEGIERPLPTEPACEVVPH